MQSDGADLCAEPENPASSARQAGNPVPERASAGPPPARRSFVRELWTPRYLSNFLSADNLGDRLMVAALLRGTHLLCSNGELSNTVVDELVQTVIGSDSARFLKMNFSQTPQDMIYDVAALPPLRLLMPEDQAWSRLDLAHKVGNVSAPGPIPSHYAEGILNKAVDCAWERTRSRLVGLSRESVIKRSLINFAAAQKEHRDWLRSMEAQFALYDSAEVQGIAGNRISYRDAASLACRVIAEMALCTSPYEAGSNCTGIDLDFLIAEVSTLLDCARCRDGLRYGLMTGQPIMHNNGSFGFEALTAPAASLLRKEHWAREFRDGVVDNSIDVDSDAEMKLANPEFKTAFIAEFGLSTEQYEKFAICVTLETLEGKHAHLRLRKSEVVQRLRAADAMIPEQAFEALALVPRSQWDERHPANATARDWYPWRYNRRLSILRRPLIQLSMEQDPIVLVMPSILAGTLDYLRQAALGRLPEELFDSSEMRSHIGRVTNRIGHDFNRKVTDRFSQLEWIARKEVSLTQLGGRANLGDIDVLAWRSDKALVFAVECKSLRFDRTLGEIGERLTEYAIGTIDGKRTRLQRHLDRISFLRSNMDKLSIFTGIPVGRLKLRSALVTENLSPMQFSVGVQEILDVVTDYELLEEAIEIQ